MEGWIKLHRQMLENPIVMKDSDHLAVWIYLLLNATHKEYPAMFKGEKITLKAGQLLTGRKAISTKLKIEETKVKRILTLFENDQQIARQRSNQNSLISILQWDSYQEDAQPNAQRMPNECPTDAQRVPTNKNVKNVKNVINTYIEPSELNDALLSFIEFRKGIKKPMTDRAINLLIGKLKKLSNNTAEQIEILEQSVVNGWTGIYPLKGDNSNKQKPKIDESKTDLDDLF